MKRTILFFLMTVTGLVHGQIFDYASSLNGKYNSIYCMSPDQSQSIIVTPGTSKDWFIQLNWTTCEGEESYILYLETLTKKTGTPPMILMGILLSK